MADNQTAATLPPWLDGAGTVPPEEVPEGFDESFNGVLPLNSDEFRSRLVENRTDTDLCGLGYICEGTEQVNCTRLQYIPIFWGLGRLHAGLWCPDGKDTYQNCPAGYYCPNPERKIPCPSGYFCPHKTAEPAISCDACESGTETIERAAYGYVVLIVLFVLCVAFFFFLCVKRKKQKELDRWWKLMGRRINSVRLEAVHRRQKSELEAIKPQLEILARRLNSETLLSVKDGTIVFDSRQLFDHVDSDGDGILTYQELNSLLQLQHVELRDFVRRMNERDLALPDQNSVSRSVFCRHFVGVLAQTSHLRPTEEEAGGLWDEMAQESERDPDEGLDASAFYDSGYLSSFLTDRQIHDIFVSLQELSSQGKVDDASSRRYGGLSMSLRLGGGIGETIRHSLGVSRQVFAEHYPEVLIDVITESDPEVTMRHHEETAASGVDIAFQDLSLTVHAGGKDVKVVDGVTGRLRAGTMVSLVGGSGAGKSSLLNALCGRAFYGTTTGTIHINGHESSIEEHRGSVGFVPQDDIVYPELTVRENFVYSGRFQLPKGTPLEEIYRLADKTLADLGLSRVATSLVGDVHRRGVSGGEKKRVNIGLELMSRPRALFLDEPTSGLDSSSALLVMQSIRRLVDEERVTVCSVIHQPRKVIFEMFDDIIILGAGGKVVYNGAVSRAQSYIEQRNFRFPQGDSLADWLIDVSAGQVEPEDDEPSQGMAPMLDQFESNSDIARIRREKLYDAWESHFGALTGEERAYYEAPVAFSLPSAPTRPSFLRQLRIQLRRIAVVSRRNIASKVVDTFIIVGAIVLISLFEGVVEVTKNHQVDIPFEALVSGDPRDTVKQFGELFGYALSPPTKMIEYALKTGIITSVLIGLTATKAITEKRLEFFREAASGYDVNAYFLAVNIMSTLEHTVQAFIAAAAAFWLRDSVAGWASYYVSFVMMAWLCVSWALLFPLLVAPKNVVLATGFFMAFFGILFSGGLSPVTYEDIYESDGLALFSGLLSPTRYFIETLPVAEQRCLPEQSGFTQTDIAVNFPQEYSSFALLHLAQNDPGVTKQSCSGWYWGVLPALFVGITIRIVGFGAINMSCRSKQAKRPFREELRYDKTRIAVSCYAALLVSSFGVACWLILGDDSPS